MSNNILDDLLGGAPPKPTTIKISKLRLDGGTQMRAALDDNTVFDYVQSMVSMGGWGTFPPAIVFHDGREHWVADGFHRIAAHREAYPEVDAIPAEIRAGTRRDAILHAAAANANHGLRRTQADKRRSVSVLLGDAEWCQWSDREIARRCHVSPDLVGAVRRELTPPVTVVSDSEPLPAAPSTRTYTTKHGGTATMNTAAIGKTKAQRAEDMIPLVLEFAAGWRNIMGHTLRDYNPNSAAHSNGQFWAAITKHFKQRGIAYQNDPLKIAIKTAVAKLRAQQPAPTPVSQRPDYESDEWYTPENIIRTAAGVMLRIDCDPATCELAQTVVQAGTYYTKDDDGLKHEWRGNVWLNPPYSTPQVWIDKLFAELLASRCTQAIVLVNNATETAWFQRLLAEAKLVCFPSKRLAFWRHDHNDMGARQGQALFYFGSRAEIFHGAFSNIGPVLRRIK